MAWILSVLVFFATTQVFGSPKKCDDNLKKTSLWTLAPKGRQLVVGMLAEALDGKLLLAVSDYYWGSHASLYQHMHKAHPLKRILWAGEMLLENSKRKLAQGRVVLTINTSAFAFGRQEDPATADINNPEALRMALEINRPDLVTAQTQFWEYSDEHAHLDPLFQSMQDRVHYSKGDTVRHRFRNVLGVIVSLSHYLTKSPSMTWQEEIELLNRVSTETTADIIQFMESRYRFSQGRGRSTSVDTIDILARLREEDKQSRVGDLSLLVDLIKNAGPRFSIFQDVPEFMILNKKK